MKRVRVAISAAIVMSATFAWAPPPKALGHGVHSEGWLRGAGLLPPTAAVAIDNRTGRVFAVSMVEGSLSVLDDRSGALLHRLDMGFLPGDVAVEEATGHLFVSSAVSNTVEMRDGTTGRLLRTITLPQLPVVVIPTGRRARVLVITGTPTANGGAMLPHATIAVLDGHSGRLVRTVPLMVPSGGISAIAVDERRGHVLLAAGKMIDIIDGVTGAVLHTSSTPRRLSALVVDHRTDHIFAVGAGSAIRNRIVRSAVLYTLNGATGTVTQAHRLDHVILVSASAAIDEQTHRLFIASALERVSQTQFAGGIVVCDADSGEAIRTVVPDPSAVELALAQRANRAFVINIFSAPEMLDGRTGAVLRTIAISNQAQAIAVDERTMRVFIATAITVYTLDARSGAVMRTTN